MSATTHRILMLLGAILASVGAVLQAADVATYGLPIWVTLAGAVMVAVGTAIRTWSDAA